MYGMRHSYLNIVLLFVIILSLVVLTGWLSYHAGANMAEGKSSGYDAPRIVAAGTDVPLTTVSVAENANLQDASGAARISRETGQVSVDIFLPSDVVITEGSVLAAWLVDAGNLGGIGESSVSDEDQRFGTPFVNIEFSSHIDDAPFALSLGTLLWNEGRGSYYLFYDSSDMLTPYDAVMVTIESDGNANNYDPRPGTPVLIGELP